MIKIYVNYFSNNKIISNSVLEPIQVGKALSPVALDMIADDTGENISKKNPSYCEMTGVYWAWKNDRQSEYIGFMHYRRFLDFSSSAQKRDTTLGGTGIGRLDDDFLNNCGLTRQNMAQVLAQCEGVIPEPFNVKGIGYKTLEDQYRGTKGHHIKDFMAAKSVIHDLYPDDVVFFEKMASGSLLYPCNIFVFKRDLFLEYCAWVFPILEEVEKRIDTSGYNQQEKRVIGYLSERLFTAFILKIRATHPHTRFKERPMVFIQDTAAIPSGPKPPRTDLSVISIVASSDQAYLPHLATLIYSIFDSAQQTTFVDFIVLDGGISEIDKTILKKIPASYGGRGRITFVDMSKNFLDIKVHSYFTRSTFYRLVLPDILKDYQRVLFLDTDMVVISDLTELFATDTQGKAIAAVRDLAMASFVGEKAPSIIEANRVPAQHYISDYLGMGDAYKDYFQAGTILFNLDLMRERHYASKMMRDITQKKYWFLDQDVLNKNLKGDVHFLDHQWNFLFIHKNNMPYLGASDKALYEDSLKAPKILHFAGALKPWINDEHPLGFYYWVFARKTHRYETVLKQYVNKKATLYGPGTKAPQSGFVWNLLRRVWRALPPDVKRIIHPIAIQIVKGKQ
ncbi:MAG: DUF4422 domain-containing protein [Acetobacter syzygii]